MRNQKGFEVVEVMIFLTFVAVLINIGYDLFYDDSSETQKTALTAAENFIKRNGIDVKEMTCAENADMDGYGICKILTQNGENIVLNCPTELSENLKCEEIII
jgi:Tfp pilus assembly major pilin PilA